MGFSYSFYVSYECPSKYANNDFNNRKQFTDWLQSYGQKLLLKSTDETEIYHYKTGQYDGCVAVVHVDVSRPWLIHVYDGKERIWYLDNIDTDTNQVHPDVQSVKGGNGFCMDSCFEDRM